MDRWGRLGCGFVLMSLVIACMAGCSTVKNQHERGQTENTEVVKQTFVYQSPAGSPCYYERFRWIIFFDPHSSRIKSMYRYQVEKLTKQLVDYPMMKININGYVDDAEGSKRGLLSQARADAIMNVSVKEYGFDPRRMSAQGYGYVSPQGITESETRGEKRALNRRVEVRNDETTPVVERSCL